MRRRSNTYSAFFRIDWLDLLSRLCSSGPCFVMIYVIMVDATNKRRSTKMNFVGSSTIHRSRNQSRGPSCGRCVATRMEIRRAKD